MTRYRRLGGVLDHFLENHVHEQEQRLSFHYQNDTLFIWVVIEMLVDAAIFDDQGISRLPVDPATVVYVMAFTFQHKEDSRIHVPVLLTVATGSVNIDMSLD